MPTLGYDNVAAGRIAIVTTDILDVSRMDLGKLRLELAEIDAEEVITAAAAALETTAADKSIVINMQVEPLGVPLVADSARVQQIVWNLLTNAIKFSSAGGRIDVSLCREGGVAELRVRDATIDDFERQWPHLGSFNCYES